MVLGILSLIALLLYIRIRLSIKLHEKMYHQSIDLDKNIKLDKTITLRNEIENKIKEDIVRIQNNISKQKMDDRWVYIEQGLNLNNQLNM